MITINNLEKMKQYYNPKTNTYEFVDENADRLDVKFNFDLNVCANIYAGDIVANVNGDVDVFNINAYDIKANDIKAWDIKARDINADNIDASNIEANKINAYFINASDIKARSIKASGNIEYGAVCFAYNDIECKSIKGSSELSKHFSFYGKIKIIKDEPKPQEMTIAEIEK